MTQQGSAEAAAHADPEMKPAKSWCSWCGQPVKVSGTGPEPGRPVHVATGSQLGGDNHLAAPVDREPELWRAAREIAGDYRGTFRLDARFGILRAEWSAKAGLPGTPLHYEAHDEAGMRRQLDEAVAGTRGGRPA